MLCFFFFNDTATTEIYTLSLHDALPILPIADLRADTVRSGDERGVCRPRARRHRPVRIHTRDIRVAARARSEEHTSELQSPCNLVCRLLLEKKKNKQTRTNPSMQDVTLD